MVIIKKAVPGVSETSLARFAQRARRAAGLRGQVNILLTSSRDLRALNRRFRRNDKPTDVLSFPPADFSAHWPPAAGHFPDFSGDIVISTDIAARNARLYRHAPAQELKILILHGMLHLAGYDHESDRGQMAAKEERLRRDLGLSDALIRRTERVAHAPSRGPGARSQTRGPGARSPSNATAKGQRRQADGLPRRSR